MSAVANDRPGVGATLIHPALMEGQVLAYPCGIPACPAQRGRRDDGSSIRRELPGTLQSALEHAFTERPGSLPQRSRAILVVHYGRIVGERYAPGFGPESPIAGWSLAKVVMNALTGILVRGSRLKLSDPAPVAEWSRAGDARRGHHLGTSVAHDFRSPIFGNLP